MQIVDRDHESLWSVRANMIHNLSCMAPIWSTTSDAWKCPRKVYYPQAQLAIHTVSFFSVFLESKSTIEALTFHHVDYAANIALLDDEAACAVLHRVHAVHDLADLRHLQVLHEVIVQDGGFDDFAGSADGKNDIGGLEMELVCKSSRR